MSGYFNKIVVPISGSEAAHKAAKEAVRMAGSMGAEILAIHVVKSFDVQKYGELTHEDEYAILKKMNISGEKYLAYISEYAKKHDVPIKTFLKQGIPAEEIIGLAKTENADLIAIGSVGGTGMRTQIIGSTTDRVIRWATGIPVLVITF